MRVLVVGNAALSDLILRVGDVPGSSTVSTLLETPGGHSVWLPGGAATTIALAVREYGHEVELCHPLPEAVEDRPSLLELRRHGIGLTRSPRISGRAGRCVLVYGGGSRLAWSTPPNRYATVNPERALEGIDYVVIAPAWSRLSAEVAREANCRGIPCAMVGEFAPEAAAIAWDLVVVDRVQHDAAKGLRAVTVVVTAGLAGVTVVSGSGETHVDAKLVELVDATGAGDTYGGTFIGARLAGKDDRTAAGDAAERAAACCEGDGSWAAYARSRPTAAPAALDLTTRDRVLGALWGTACGDAFGMPNSFLQELPWLTEMVPGPANSPYHAGYPAGRITDDTEQALALTEAMRDGFTAENVASRLQDWFCAVGGEHSLAVGPSTKRAMMAFAAGGDVFEIGRTGVTNGAAMRVAPVGILAGLRSLPLAGLIDLVETSCVPTHHTSPAISGAGAVAAGILAAVGGASWPEVMEAAIRGAVEGARRGNWIYAPDISERIRLALGIAEASATPIEFTRTISSVVGTGEPCTESVPAALAAAHFAQGDPALAIELCANARGDTDTTAAMAGGICGAFSGWRRIPPEWRVLVSKVNRLDVEAWADSWRRQHAREAVTDRLRSRHRRCRHHLFGS